MPIMPGSRGAVSLEDARDFFANLDAGRRMIIKAVAGGGGRGVRIVEDWSALEEAWTRCRSEAEAAFGKPDVYVEAYLDNARHVEVQVVGDGTGRIIHLGDRDCSVQRRQQKIIEIASAPGLLPETRAALADAAIRLGQASHYTNIGTFEFLVDNKQPERFMFMEANPRLQVEHTITEMVAGVDLVALQLRLASGETLEAIDLPESPRPSGMVRINMETMLPDGSALPGGGVIERFNPPSGPGIRVDTFGYPGYSTNPRFDSLLAKVIVHHRQPDFEALLKRCYRALCEFDVAGVPTNLDFTKNLVQHPDIEALNYHTR
ncbi:MAG: carbamoyl-phosphate synthase large subunit, partial [Gammaproteobacteria bacterium]|nr:carbamoyl-phosphate synthase large subunit [Gammaproteobacteria bacterium]